MYAFLSDLCIFQTLFFVPDFIITSSDPSRSQDMQFALIRAKGGALVRKFTANEVMQAISYNLCSPRRSGPNVHGAVALQTPATPTPAHHAERRPVESDQEADRSIGGQGGRTDQSPPPSTPSGDEQSTGGRTPAQLDSLDTIRESQPHPTTICQAEGYSAAVVALAFVVLAVVSVAIATAWAAFAGKIPRAGEAGRRCEEGTAYFNAAGGQFGPELGQAFRDATGAFTDALVRDLGRRARDLIDLRIPRFREEGLQERRRNNSFNAASSRIERGSGDVFLGSE